MLVKIKLGKEWNKHRVGSTVEVDPVRAKWLRDHDFEETNVVEMKAKKKGK